MMANLHIAVRTSFDSITVVEVRKNIVTPVACMPAIGDRLNLPDERLADLTGLRVIEREVGEVAVLVMCEAILKEPPTEKPAKKVGRR
jgi:hypothetical protein